MNNITWGETIGNWGSNKQDSKSDTEVQKQVEEKQKISGKELLVLKMELLSHCEDLINKTTEVYGIVSSKELYDSIVTLTSAKRFLDLIYICEEKEPVKEKV